MNITEIKVPDGIRYLGQWKEFGEQLPDCHLILDKSHTGVGATQYFLTNKEKVILCSPRCSLIENKRAKHPEAWVFRDISDNAVIDDDDGKSKKKAGRKKATYEEIMKYKDEVVKYTGTCMANGQTPKIMVTYDSLGHVISALQAFGITELDTWTLVVDEFQQIFGDSTFKSLTEMMFLENSLYFKKVIYLSATPYLHKYMELLDEFRDLPFYKLIWPKEMEEQAVVTNITIKPTETRNQVCRKIISKMKAGKTIRFGNVEIDSTEAVFYLNNVRDIIHIIKACGLKQEEVNILCSPSSEEKLNKAGLALGNFPAEGERHKPFTFCTRSVYLGVDFYSECAVSYIFADPTQQTLALDISTDLPQILGRQRLDRNPYRNRAFLFVKENSMGLEDEEFEKYIEKKASDTKKLIDDYLSKSPELQEIQLKKYRTSMEVDKYKNDYLMVVEEKKTEKATVQFNRLRMLAEMRAWEISKKNLSSQYSIIKEQRNAGITAYSGTQSENPDVLAFKSAFESTRITDRRIRTYCDFRKAHPELADEIDFISPKYAWYWDALGYDDLKSMAFQESTIIAALREPTRYDGGILEEVTQSLRERLKGKKYECGQLKKIMADVYKKAKYLKTAKACDIGNYVTVKPYQNYKTGRKGYEILSLYQKWITVFPLVFLPNRPVKMNIDRFLDIIRTGKYTVRKLNEDAKGRQLKDVVDEIRNESNHDRQNTLKRAWLPVGCINGSFKTKHERGLEIYSSFVALDFDGFTCKEEMLATKDELKKIPFIYAIYETPSGLGLKAIIIHDSTNPAFHWNLYLQLVRKCNFPQLDNSVSDLSRGHYMSYDPDLWLNPNPEPYQFRFDPSLQPEKDKDEKTTTNVHLSTVEKSQATYEQITSVDEFLNHICRYLMTDEAIMNRLDHYWRTKKPEYFKQGQRHDSMLIMAGTMCKAGIPKDMALRYLLDSYKDMEQSEIESVTEFAYDRNSFGCDRRFYRKKK